MNNTKSNFLLIALLMISFLARADFTGPPAAAVYTMWTLGLVGGFLGCMLLAYVFKKVVELFIKHKRKHIWYQSICMFVLLATILYALEEKNLLYTFEGKYGYEVMVQFQNFLIVASLIAGCIIGYFITPKKVSDRNSEYDNNSSHKL